MAKKPLSTLEFEKLYFDMLAPYAKELGVLLHTWNNMQWEMARLFLAIAQMDFDNEEEEEMLLAIWNSVPNDRMQRHMLRNAATVRFTRLEKRMEGRTRVEIIVQNERRYLDEILWILETADKLGRKRDDATHVPMVCDTSGFTAEEWLGHPIAKQLSGKDLLAEFSLYRARMETLRIYVHKAASYFSEHSEPMTFPDRPTLPSVPPSSAHKDAKEPKRAKQPERPPRSSSE